MQAKKALALRAASTRLLEDLQSLPSTEQLDAAAWVGDLVDAMTRHPGAHQSIKESRSASVDVLKKVRVEEFSTTINAVRDEMQELSPLPLPRNELIEALGPGWAKKRDQAAEAFAKGAINTVFPPARDTAVQRQREDIQRQLVYPSFEPLDQKIADLNFGPPLTPLEESAFQPLKPWLNEQTLPDVVVFEELRDWADDLSGQVLAEIVSQHRAQVHSVAPRLEAGEAPPDLLTPPSLSTYFLTLVRESETHTPETGIPDYPVFTAVTRWIDAWAVEIARRRLTEHMEKAGWTPGEAWIRETMEENPPAHRERADSLNLLSAAIIRTRLDPLLDGYLEPVPEARRAAAADALKTLIGTDPPHPWFLVHMEALIAKPLDRARSQLAEQQIASGWPGLMKQKALTEAQARILYSQSRRQPADFNDSLEVLKAEEGAMTESVDIKRLLEEAEKKIHTTVSELAARSLPALAAQLQDVDHVEQDNREALRQSVFDGATAKELEQEWRALWNQRWDEREPSLRSVYPDRLELTEETLLKAVRQFFESMTKEKESLTAETEAEGSTEQPTDKPSSRDTVTITAPEPGGEQSEQPEVEAPGGGTAAGMQETLSRYRGVADGVFAFRDLGDGQCELVFGTPDGLDPVTLTFDPADVETAANLVADATKASLYNVLDHQTEENPTRGFLFFRNREEPELKLMFRVDSREVRHRMSILLRDRIRDDIRNWAETSGQPAPDLSWQDDVATD